VRSSAADDYFVTEESEHSAFGEVSTILWRERQMLELLVFKLEEEQLILAAGKAKWLPHATREVEMILEQIKRVELVRSIKVDALATDLGLEPGPTLRILAETCEQPWAGIFDGHRLAFLQAVEEIRILAETNRSLLARGHQVTREALAWITSQGPEPQAYTHVGAMAYGPSSPHLFNKAL
jgi:FlgN protein